MLDVNFSGLKASSVTWKSLCRPYDKKIRREVVLFSLDGGNAHKSGPHNPTVYPETIGSLDPDPDSVPQHCKNIYKARSMVGHFQGTVMKRHKQNG